MRIIEVAVVLLFSIIGVLYLPNVIIRRNCVSLRFLTFAIVVQNIVCVMANDTFGSTMGQFIILYKEFILYGGVCTYLILTKKGKISKRTLPFIAVIGVLGMYLFVGTAEIYTKLICFRQIMTPIILVLYGSTIQISRNELVSFTKFIMNLGVFQVIFGFMERFILGDSFWLALHIEKYMESKGFSQWIYSNGLPGNYYSADLYSVIGTTFRRLVGITVDPLLTGHFLAFCIVILLFVKVYNSNLKQNIVLILMTAAVVLTFSKGALLIIALAYWYKMWRKNRGYAILLLAIMFLGVGIIIKRNIFYTVQIHIEGLTSSFSIRSLLGNGLGSAGNYAVLYGTSSTTSGESYIGMLLAQTGILGLSVFVYAFAKWSGRIIRINKTSLSYSVFAYIIAVLVEALVSESAVNYVGSGIAFVILGIMIHPMEQVPDLIERIIVD